MISLRNYSQPLNNVNICTALRDSFCTTCCIFLAQIASHLSQVCSHTSFFLNISIFKNHPRKRVSRNASLNNLGNDLQRNLRTNRTRECIFRAYGDTKTLKKVLDMCEGVCMRLHASYAWAWANSSRFYSLFLMISWEHKFICPNLLNTRSEIWQ